MTYIPLWKRLRNAKSRWPIDEPLCSIARDERSSSQSLGYFHLKIANVRTGCWKWHHISQHVHAPVHSEECVWAMEWYRKKSPIINTESSPSLSPKRRRLVLDKGFCTSVMIFIKRIFQSRLHKILLLLLWTYIINISTYSFRLMLSQFHALQLFHTLVVF